MAAPSFFELLRQIFRMLRAYRTHRKAGVDSDEAINRAVGDVFGNAAPHPGGLTDTPSGAVARWEQAEQIYRDAHPGDDEPWFGFGPFAVTAAHIALMRQMRFGWDGVERGAPMLDAERPYGRTDMFLQLRETFPRDDTDELALQHVGMMYVLMRALRHGRLSAGSYHCRNLTAGDIRDAMAGYSNEEGTPVTDDDLGLGADGAFALTDEHLKLLRELVVRWPPESECEDRVQVWQFPAATGDGKRPYGDYTYIEIDMVRILGSEPDAVTDEDDFALSPELARHLQRLHWQMLPAIQVFVENAGFEPGTYDT